MQPPSAEPQPLGALPPLRAVIDSCVFAKRRWLEPIVLSARAGYVVALWSPCIIDETSRFRTVQWIKRCGVPTSRGERRRLSEESHRWFHYVSAAMHVVDDRPPLEPMWTPEPPDVEDQPIWTAAVRGGAHFVVTANLRDGPPPGANGIRTYNGITYVPPEPFVGLLDFWADVMATSQALGGDLVAAALDWQQAEPGRSPLPEPVQAHMRQLQERLGRS